MGAQVLDLKPDDVIVNPELRARKFAPSADAVKNLAISIYHHGQQQAGQVRSSGKKWEVVAGYTRLEAVKLIRAGFTHANLTLKNPKLTFKATEVEADDLTAVKLAISENSTRNATTPVDDAFNQQLLRERFSLTDVEISTLYNMHASKVSRLKKLLTLPPAVLRKVHERQLSYNSALELADLAPEVQEKVAEETGGNLNKIKEVVRRERQQVASAFGNTAPVRKKMRSNTQIAATLREFTNPRYNAELRTWMQMLADYAEGQYDGDTLRIAAAKWVSERNGK